MWTRRSGFVVPVGVAIDPGSEAIALQLVVGHEPVFDLTLPGGALVERRRGRFALAVGGGSGILREGSRLVLRRDGRAWRLVLDLGGVDAPGLDPAAPPPSLKALLRIGDDCFSAIVACTASGTRLRCRPERTALLRGRVSQGRHAPLPGAMVTAYDDARLESVTVFTQEDGRYVFPRLRSGTWWLRAWRVAWTDGTYDAVVLAADRATTIDFVLASTDDYALQLPAATFFSLLLDDWPDPKIRACTAVVYGPDTCAAWTQEDGPGKLAGAFLMEADPQAGDTANVNVIDDLTDSDRRASAVTRRTPPYR